MLSFSLVAEALTGLIYHRPSGENSKFLPLQSLPAFYLKTQQTVVEEECKEEEQQSQ